MQQISVPNTEHYTADRIRGEDDGAIDHMQPKMVVSSVYIARNPGLSNPVQYVQAASSFSISSQHAIFLHPLPL